MPTIRLFAGAREAAGTDRDTLDGTTVRAVLDAAVERYGAVFAAILGSCRVWVNGEPASPEDAVGDGDREPRSLARFRFDRDVDSASPASGSASRSRGRAFSRSRDALRRVMRNESMPPALSPTRPSAWVRAPAMAVAMGKGKEQGGAGSDRIGSDEVPEIRYDTARMGGEEGKGAFVFFVCAFFVVRPTVFVALLCFFPCCCEVRG